MFYDLECPKPVQHSLFYASVFYFLPFGLGGAVNTPGEDHP